MGKQRSKQEKLSLKVTTMLYVVGECATRFSDEILKEKLIVDCSQEKYGNNNERAQKVNYWAFISYLFVAVNCIKKKTDTGFTEKDFIDELRKQLKKTVNMDLFQSFDDIENYKDGVIKFVGNKLCKEFNIESAIMEFEINLLFNSFLLYGFYESIERAWVADDYIEK